MTISSKQIQKRIPVIRLNSLLLSSILKFVDGVYQSVSQKPNNFSMLQSIYELYQLTLNESPSEEFKKEWELKIESCNDFASFWIEVKHFLNSHSTNIN